MKHVILGNGPTGVVAAEAIRKKHPADEIVIVGDEHERPYSRMAIPYLLEGKIAESGTLLRHDRDHWKKSRIDLLEARAVSVDGPGKTVKLSNGDTLAFDRLLLATGSRPVRPPIPGMDLPDVVSCWTLEDARAILERMRPGAKVLQMGAGFIGCIIMEAIATSVGKTGGSLTVVEMGDRMVPRMMTPMASSLIRKWSEKAGVEVVTSTRVTAIEANTPKGGLLSIVFKRQNPKERVIVTFGDGSIRKFDFVICATGVAPAIDYLKGSGVEIGKLGGIVVDDRMQTTVPDVYSAGDCTESVDFSTGEFMVNAIQPNAADQALVAGANMAGGDARTKGGLRMNVLETFGLISTSYGQWWGAEGGDHVELVDEEAFAYIRLEFLGDRVIGATVVGRTHHVGALRGLIQTGVRLTPEWKAKLKADPNKFMDAWLACSLSAA
ncbi:MAG: NAD(P)/FAD-dependent oxidoreductase [Phyllobacteriaceae bacterium]|nr:NAD(P)/FAD-dependent oxidoreductase [Phyllobacteriaceae bacterium]